MYRTIYKIISLIASPVIIFYMFIRLIRGKENTTSLSQKLTIKFANYPKNKQIIWFHAASVGETNMAIALIKIISDKRPDLHILMTTATLTSAKIFKLEKLNNTTHQFLPIDLNFIVKRFINYWNPKIVIFIESELWPNLIDQINTKDIPILLFNGRLSDSSFAMWSKYKNFTSSILRKFSVIYTASQLDYNRFITFTKDNVEYIGHFKYSSPSLSYSDTYVKELKSKLKNKNVFVAVSTHDGEEKIIVKIHKELKENISNIFTIIIPRHPSRIEEIISLSENYKLDYITDIKDFKDENDLLLISAFGILGNFFEAHDIIFVGGSFANIGGHNILEPAKQNCAIIVGPYTSNFKDLIDEFVKHKAIITTQTTQQLKNELQKLFNDSKYKEQLIKNSTKIINKQKDVFKVALNTIYEYLK